MKPPPLCSWSISTSAAERRVKDGRPAQQGPNRRTPASASPVSDEWSGTARGIVKPLGLLTLDGTALSTNSTDRSPSFPSNLRSIACIHSVHKTPEPDVIHKPQHHKYRQRARSAKTHQR